MWLAGYVAASLLLFLCYVRVSGTVPVTADGGNNAMQAWDMLHGNWLLRGWVLGDASYFATELPGILLIDLPTAPLRSSICRSEYLHAAHHPGRLLAKGDNQKKALIRVYDTLLGS